MDRKRDRNRHPTPAGSNHSSYADGHWVGTAWGMWIENVKTSLHSSITGLLLQDRPRDTGIFHIVMSSLRNARVIKRMAAALGLSRTQTVTVGQCNTVGTSL